MSRENNPIYGAIIERGVIVKVNNDTYTIKSYDRDGITTLPIKRILHKAVYHVGDRVFFFLFQDGSGRILGPMDD
jgi:hypothetical protein